MFKYKKGVTEKYLDKLDKAIDNKKNIQNLIVNKRLSNYKTNSEKKAYLENLLLEANNKLDNIERHNNLKIPTLMSGNLFIFLFSILAANVISTYICVSSSHTIIVVIFLWALAIVLLNLSSIIFQSFINSIYLNRKRFIQAIESLLNELNKK